MQIDQILTVRDAGAILGITSSAVRALEIRGRLRAFRDSTGRRLFLVEDVERLKRERERRRETRHVGSAKPVVPAKG